MKQIDIKGDIISNDLTWIYDWMEWEYTSPGKIQKALENANKDDVEFLINSPGGDVFAGYEIFNLIKCYEGHTTSNIVGLAASCGSFIPMASKRVISQPMAMMMIHGASTSTRGNQHNHEHTRDFLSKVDRTIVRAYTSRNGKTDEEMLELMAKETWFTAEEMLEMGLIDEIVGESSITNQVKVYNSAQDESKREILDKLMSLGSIENVKQALLNKQLNLGKGVVNSAHNDIENEEEQPMTINELKEKEPELYNQIVEEAQQEAITNERARVAAIHALAKPGTEEQIKDGIENGLNAGEVAINILNAQTALNNAQLENMTQDAEESGVNHVGITATPQNTNEQEKQLALSNMANIMNGGRK